MRRGGIGHKRFELEIQDQKFKRTHWESQAAGGALFLVRVRVEFLSPSETCCRLSQDSEVQLLVMNGS